MSRASPRGILECGAGQPYSSSSRWSEDWLAQGEVLVVGPFFNYVLPCPTNPTSAPDLLVRMLWWSWHSYLWPYLWGLPASHGNHSPLGTLTKTPAQLQYPRLGEIDSYFYSAPLGWSLSHTEIQTHGPLELSEVCCRGSTLWQQERLALWGVVPQCCGAVYCCYFLVVFLPFFYGWALSFCLLNCP